MAEVAALAAMRGRGEVDTSSQFESVRQAVDRFGGGAVSPWRQPPQPPPPPLQLRPEEVELMKVEEQTVKVEMGLFVKESETFKVLKELESTKQVIDDLKLQIEKATSECGNAATDHADTMKIHPLPDIERNPPPDIERKVDDHVEPLIQSINAIQSPLTTLMKLNQAKAFLNMDTVKMFKCQIEEEKASLERTRERVQLNMEKASALEAELSETAAQLQAAIDPKPVLEPYDIWLQMKQLNAEKDKHGKTVEDSKLEICELTSTIEHTRSKAKTIQFRIVMAGKLKEASRRGEAFALAEMGKRSNVEDPGSATSTTDVTLSVEEHSKLLREAEEAEAASRSRIDAAMQELDEANHGKAEVLERVDEAMAAVESSRKVLEEALRREESANKAKLAAEDALRRLRSDQIILNWRPTRNSSNNPVKFKASATPAMPRKAAGTGIYDVNGLSLVATTPKSTKAMSIGQILSMKLDCEFETGATGKTAGSTKKKKVSLGQMLSQKYEMYSPMRIDHDGASRKQFHPRRRRLGFVVYALLLARQKHRKKRQQASCAKVV